MSRFKTEEEKQAWAADMRKRKEAKKLEGTWQVAGPAQPETTLDVTRDNLISEADLIERIRRMFDDGATPTLIKVNSKQLLEILDTSNRWDDRGYSSPFGYIEVEVVPAKELL